MKVSTAGDGNWYSRFYNLSSTDLILDVVLNISHYFSISLKPLAEIKMKRKIAGYRKFIRNGYQSLRECAKLCPCMPWMLHIPNIPRMPFQILSAQWKICEKFPLGFCFPKQKICWNFLHKALELQCDGTPSKIIFFFQKPRLDGVAWKSSVHKS